MNIAYIILAHRAPEQLLRLVHRLRDEDAAFFIHIDQRANSADFRRVISQLSQEPNTFFVKRYPCFWGHFNIARATIAAIHQIIASSFPFDYAFLLSGQDYPIKSTADIKAFLRKNRGKEFIESFSLLGSNPWSTHEGRFQSLNRVQHWHLSVRGRMLYLPLQRNFPEGFKPYGGSQWWCLSQDSVQYIHHLAVNNPRFINYFKTVLIPDEILIQTILSNSPFKQNLVSDDLKFADWENPNPNRPATLLAHDFDRLFRSPKLFARKFDMDRDSQILDLIDQQILTKTATVMA